VSQPNPTAANPDLVLTYDQILNLGGVLTVSVTTNAIEIHLPPIPLAGVGWSSLSVGAMIVKSGSPNVVNIDTFTP
jgi:hypothetical protein